MAYELAWTTLPILCYLLLKFLSRHNGPMATLVGPDGQAAKAKFYTSGKNLVYMGYQKSREKLFKIWTPDGYLHILPDHQLQELKNVADDHIRAASTELGCLPQYTGVMIPEFGIQTIKQELTRSLGCILPQLVEEVEFSFANEMPSCKDWAPINAFQTIMRIIAIVSGRVISGHELAHNPEWIELSVSFTTDVFKAAGKLKFFPSFLRPIVQHFLPEMKRIKRAYATSHRLVDPVLKVRSEAAQWPGYVKPNDFVQWIADRMASEGLGYDQANMQLSFGLASIHTTAMTAVQIVYELAARPNEYEMLREDITEALRGSEGGSIDKHVLARMKKLDSFMKEVQRLHPLSHVAWLRRITAPVTLSDVHFPTDTLVAIPARPRAINSTNWPNSTAFDALRFYRMRERSAADAHLHQFTSIPSDANMFPFGYGKHACPGRFFASQEIKVLLIYLILNYDLRVPSEGTRSHERPVDFEIGLAIVPDPKILIEFKERTNL